MSRKVDPLLVRPGDRVRVGRESDEDGPVHGIKFGAVCEVVSVSGSEFGTIMVKGPLREGEGWAHHQVVDIELCKVAS